MDLTGDAVPHSSRTTCAVLQALETKSDEPVVPSTERRARDARCRQGAAHRKMGVLDQSDDLELLPSTSYVEVPSPEHAFSEQAVLQAQLRGRFLQTLCLAPA